MSSLTALYNGWKCNVIVKFQRSCTLTLSSVCLLTAWVIFPLKRSTMNLAIGGKWLVWLHHNLSCRIFAFCDRPNHGHWFRSLTECQVGNSLVRTSWLFLGNLHICVIYTMMLFRSDAALITSSWHLWISWWSSSSLLISFTSASGVAPDSATQATVPDKNIQSCIALMRLHIHLSIWGLSLKCKQQWEGVRSSS